MLLEMYKIIKVYRNGIIKLPASVRREAGIEVGDKLLIVVKEGKIILIPRKSFDPIEEYSSKLGENIEEEKVFKEGIKELRQILNKQKL